VKRTNGFEKQYPASAACISMYKKEQYVVLEVGLLANLRIVSMEKLRGPNSVRKYTKTFA